MAITYKNGQFDPSPIEMPERASWEEELDELGFAREVTLRLGALNNVGDGFELEVHPARRATAPAEYLVEVSVAGRVLPVLCPKTADLLALLREMAPIADIALRTQEYFDNERRRQGARARRFYA